MENHIKNESSDSKIIALCLTLSIAIFILGGELWKVIFNRSLALFAIWTTAILSVQRKTIYDEKEKALLDLKILSGLLPICASCKKIRDDKGYWNKIELYIGDRSEAEFSHGICPVCAEKLYGHSKKTHS